MKRIFLSSPVGGSGCTTLSVNLAYALSRSGRRILLTSSVDGSAGLHFEGLPRVGTKRSDSALSDEGRVQVQPNLDMRVVGSERDVLNDGREESVMHQSRRTQRSPEYDMEIVDRVSVGEFGQGDDDCLLLVVNTTAQCYRQLASYVDAKVVGPSRESAASLTYVINQHVPESYLSADILRLMNESLGTALFSDVLMVDELIRESAASGLPLLEYASCSASLQSIERLVEHICSTGSRSHAAA